jgi:hypothetical protein
MSSSNVRRCDGVMSIERSIDGVEIVVRVTDIGRW